jgi:hypothetical protein
MPESLKATVLRHSTCTNKPASSLLTEPEWSRPCGKSLGCDAPSQNASPVTPHQIIHQSGVQSLIMIAWLSIARPGSHPFSAPFRLRARPVHTELRQLEDQTLWDIGKPASTRVIITPKERRRITTSKLRCIRRR